MMHAQDFWEFMREREAIRLRRLNGMAPPWSADPIFKTYNFTNVKRVHDRVTALLKKEFYDPRPELSHPSPIALLNSAIFRFHGIIGTARAIGWSDDWNNDLKKRMISITGFKKLAGDKVFTGAYIIPSCGDPRDKCEVVADIIDGIWKERDWILSTDSWEEACRALCTLWGVGQFMAKEILLDYILATGWIPNDWETWTPVGPGARRGAGVVVGGEVKGIPVSEALNIIRILYNQRNHQQAIDGQVLNWENPYWPEEYVELELTDIQFQLCEFAKYWKAKTGVGRPKRKFNPTIDEITKATVTVQGVP